MKVDLKSEVVSLLPFVVIAAIFFWLGYNDRRITQLNQDATELYERSKELKELCGSGNAR